MMSLYVSWYLCVGVRNNGFVLKIEKFDLCFDEVKVLKGVELKVIK